MTHRLLLPSATLLTAGALLAAPAVAHSPVASTSPKSGAVAKRTTLRTVSVTFKAGIVTGTVKVTRAGRQVSIGAGRRVSSRTLRTTLRRPVRAGRHTARWVSVSGDGHRQTGSFTFTVR